MNIIDKFLDFFTIQLDRMINIVTSILEYFAGKNIGPHRNISRVKTAIVVKVARQANKYDPVAYVKAALLNISKTGFCIEAPQEFVIGDTLVVNISLPSGQQYGINGKVVWVKDQTCTYLLGISVTDNSDELNHLLKYFNF
ncbi:MAG: PilZ domain-containing protein [Elusimicrobia bacterium]|nr:PilZ domain-containing protein [Elusimicrobiota bacterium]